MAATSVSAPKTITPVVLTVVTDGSGGFVIDIPFTPSYAVVTVEKSTVRYYTIYDETGSMTLLLLNGSTVSTKTRGAVTVTKNTNNNTRVMTAAISAAPASAVVTVVLYA